VAATISSAGSLSVKGSDEAASPAPLADDRATSLGVSRFEKLAVVGLPLTNGSPQIEHETGRCVSVLGPSLEGFHE
jgi:hypothetical protein